MSEWFFSIAVRRCKALAHLFGLAAASALLAACTAPQDLPLTERAVACPKTAIVSGLESVTLFAYGSGQDPSDMLMRGTLVELSGECAYQDDRVTLDVQLIISGERGPALQDGQTVAVDFFVAVLEPDMDISKQKVFTADFTFDDRRTRAVSREDLRQVIPLPNARSGQSYSVLMGFQLTAEQRAFNQSQ